MSFSRPRLADPKWAAPLLPTVLLGKDPRYLTSSKGPRRSGATAVGTLTACVKGISAISLTASAALRAGRYSLNVDEHEDIGLGREVGVPGLVPHHPGRTGPGWEDGGEHHSLIPARFSRGGPGSVNRGYHAVDTSTSRATQFFLARNRLASARSATRTRVAIKRHLFDSPRKNHCMNCSPRKCLAAGHRCQPTDLVGDRAFSPSASCASRSVELVSHRV